MRSTKIILLFAAALFTSFAALSQDTTNETTVVVDDVVDADAKVETQVESTETSTSRKGVEKVEVTGSHIRRTDVEGPSPVVTIDRQQIENSGFNSVGQILRGSTVTPFGGDGSSVNLRGVGSGRTLVLINGQRAPKSGSSYSSAGTDPNFVPLAAVERIEILKDGASATYGSDALGGVVNIITRRNIDGISFATKYDHTEYLGGDESRTSLAYANSTAKSSFMTSLQYTFNQGSRYSAQSHLKPYVRNPRFSNNYLVRDKNGTPKSKSLKAAANCPASMINPDGECFEESLSSQYLFRPSHEVGSVSTWNYDITSDTQFYTTVIANFATGGNEYPTLAMTGFGPGELNANALSEKGTSDFQQFDSGTDSIQTFGRLGDVRRPSIEDDYMGGLIVGTKGYWGNSDWTWDTSINNQILANHIRNKNYAVESRVQQAIKEQRYKPFSTQQQNVAGLFEDSVSDVQYQVNWANAKTTGEVGEFAGANWATAVGVDVANFAYSEDRDDRVMRREFIGLAGTEGRGERQMYSGYAELSGLFGKSFEAQFAVRNDNYSDFGSTVNPKLALRYQPAKSVMFRGSYGTGFQAPRLQDAYGPQVRSFPQVIDQKRCNAAVAAGNQSQIDRDCQQKAIDGLSGANRDLKEETSVSYNVGMVVEPIKRFTISLDYWNLKIEDTIGDPQLSKVLDLDADGVDVSKYGVIVARDCPTCDLKSVSTIKQNIGKEEVDGLDVEIKYLMKTKAGDFTFNTAHTYLFQYYQTFFEEYGREQVLGQFNLPRWRNTSSIRYAIGKFDVKVIARTFARTEKSKRHRGSIEGITQWDSVVGYKLAKNSQIQLGALNIFDQTPQYDETFRARINTNLYNANRTAYMIYRQDF